MKTLHINVVDKIATYYKRDGDIVCGNSDYQLEFTFDSEWEAHNSKTARIIINGEYKDVPFLGNVCTLPIIKNATQIEVGVYAGDLNTTTRAIIGCKPSILCGSSVPASNEEMDKEYTSAAKEAAQTAIGAAETAVGAVGKAEIAADRAEDALERAEEAAERAEAAGDDGNEAVIGVLESDAAVSSVKPVPETSAPYAEVVEIGGRTRKCTNLCSPFRVGEQYDFVSLTDTIRVNTNTDYVVSVKRNSLFADYYTVYIMRSDDFVHLKAFNVREDATVVFNTGDNTEIVVQINNGRDSNGNLVKAADTLEFFNNTVMLNEGDTALPYEPYFEGLRSAPVTEVESVGVNVIPEDYAAGYWEANNSGILIRNTAGTAFSNLDYVYLPPNTKYTVTGTAQFMAVFCDKNYRLISNTNWLARGSTFTTPDVTCMTIMQLKGEWDNVMVNAGTTALPYTPYSRNTLPIPEAVRPKHGINENVYDRIRWEKDGTKKSYERVGCVDMGALTWAVVAASAPTTYYARISNIKLASTLHERTTGIICAKYSATTVINTLSMDNKSIMRHDVHNTVYVRDDDYTDAATFKAAMSGVMLYYELAEPVITDISDLLPDNLIGVEDGGTLTFKNEYGYDVPNTVNFYTYNNELMCADTFVGDLKGTANKAIYDSKGRDIAEKLDELANGSGGSGGEGSPGVGIESIEQTVTSNADGGTNEITVTLTDGSTSKFNVKNGSQGSPGTPGGKGDKGDPGVGIESVEQTTTSTVDGGTNVITVKLTDGKTSTFTVKNGSTGSGGSGEGGSGENTAAAEAAAARAETAATRAETAETNAEQAASDLSGAAERAESAATAAESAENRIYETETEINQTAETVRSQAEAAEEAKGFAESYRDEAKGYSDTAQGYAGDAADEVGKAKEHADAASDNKDLALKYATAAEISKNLAETAKAEAQQAASDISGAAERAEDAATAADGHANSAYGYAEEAKGHAETARSRAEAAEEAKGFAEGYRDEAKGYSDTAQSSAGDAADEAYKAEQSASAAKTSETNAAKSATDAASAASDLSGAAERAESAATAADGYMNSAYEYAGEATTAANNAATHLQTMRDMAEIWTFTFADGTVVTKKVCIVD